MSHEIKLSKLDVETLSSIYPINQSIKVVGGNAEIRCRNAQKTIAVIAKLDTALPRTFCIYDIREFLSVVNLFDVPVLDFTNPKFVVVKSEDGKQKLRYLDAEEAIINSYLDRDIVLSSVDIAITVSEAQLKACMSAAQTLKLDYVGFKSENGKVYFCTFDKNNGSGEETNGFSVEVGESTDNFNMFYKTEALTVLKGEAKFEISKSKISRIENSGKVFFIALEAKSNFE